MDFGLGTMVKNIIAYILFICCLSFLLAGCDYTTYPYNLNVRWVSTDPNYTLEYRQATSERPYEKIECLRLNEGHLFVDVLYLADDFKVVPANATNFETVYLHGSWKMSKDELVFYIEEDNLFDGIYQEIHFTRENLE